MCLSSLKPKTQTIFYYLCWDVAITVYNWEKDGFFALLIGFVKLSGSIYFKIITAEQHPKNATSQKNTCDPMTASEYK